MKLYSEAHEIAAIGTICSAKTESIKSILLTSLKEDWFHYEPTRAAFLRLTTVLKKRQFVLSWSELVEDLALEEEYRDILRDAEVRICKTDQKAERLISSLEKYRKTRLLYYMAKGVQEALKQEAVDLEELLETAADTVLRARSNQDLARLMVSLGTTSDEVEDLIAHVFDEDAEKPLKSGYKEIDENMGGLISKGVLLLGATTSGGKSTLLLNLLVNIFQLNHVSCCNISLEMDKRKNTKRLMSRLTKIPFWKFKTNKATEEEKKAGADALRKMYRSGKRHNCIFTQLCPENSVDIDSVLALVKPYGFKVIGIDYVSLLDGVDEDNQARILSSIVRQCKIFSQANDCLVIPLVQLDGDSGKIRYSRGMLEHADLALTWKYNEPAVRETKRLPMTTAKNRDGELLNFELAEKFEIMTIEDATDDNMVEISAIPLDEDAPVDYEAGQA
jgi:replicative DNA helicase